MNRSGSAYLSYMDACSMKRATRLVCLWTAVIVLCLTGWLVGGGTVSAHATLQQSSPYANEELASSPAEVNLIFNERLENGAYYIRVMDVNKRAVTDEKAVMNPERTGLSLKLPTLPNGTYLVTYHVISADGHPVGGTYLFAVGESLDELAAGIADELVFNYEADPFRSMGWQDILLFVSRVGYYILLLVFTGWLLWTRIAANGLSEPLRSKVQAWTVRLQQSYIIAYIVLLWVHLPKLLGDNVSGEELLRLLTGTTVGYAWLGGLVLALLSFVMLQRGLWLTLLWSAAVWFAKSWLGHPAAFEPKDQLLLLDWLHLAASSLWAGGLVLLLVMWRVNREEARRFYRYYSDAALICIALLAVSGALLALLYLPQLSYVLLTGWGKLLLLKTGIVLLVLVTAWSIRAAFRKKETAVRKLLIFDAVWMLLIAGIVGIFTILAPLPVNKPVNWHEMGETIHMTAQISPGDPGVNDFTLKVWLPESQGEPKEVVMKLRDVKSPDMAPLAVPLAPVQDTSAEESFGMVRHTYKARGAYMPYAGTWELEIRVMDKNDDETVYKNQLIVY